MIPKSTVRATTIASLLPASGVASRVIIASRSSTSVAVSCERSASR